MQVNYKYDKVTILNHLYYELFILQDNYVK